MKRALIFLLLLIPASLLVANPRMVLSVGHAGAVRDSVGHPSEEIAFTVGDDGRLLVWDLENNALRYRYQVSHHPITRVVHHPTRNEVAVVVNEGVDSSTIRVINWETGEVVFGKDLDSVPLHLSYSPAGTYLVYTLPSFQSLFFLDADSGSTRSYLDDGFGIVNFIQMAGSERVIMTYVPGRGEFIYWELRSGDEALRVETLRRLSHLTLVDPENRRALAAATEDELVVVDNYTGEERATYPISPIHGIQYDAENDRIMVLTEQLGRRIILSFTYSNGRLRRDFFQPTSLGETAQFVVPLHESANAVLSGDLEGNVVLFSDSSGRRTELGPRPITPIIDAAFTEGRLHLSLGDRILTLVSDGLRSTSRSVYVSSVRYTVTPVPEMSGALLESADDRLLIYGATNPAGTVLELSPPSMDITSYYVDEQENPIRQVQSTDDGPLVIHRDGRIVQLSAILGTPRYQYAARGVQTATWAPQLGLIVAKTRASSFDPSVIRVDQLTGETVPIQSDAFLSTDIALGDNSTLYCIGLHGTPAQPTTVLSRFSGSRFEQSSSILEFAGEDPLARLLWDDRTDTLYTTLGYEGLLQVDGRTVTPLESTGQVPRAITSGGVFIATVNSDGSVSLWNRLTGEFVLDIYVMGDDHWLVMAANGAYYASHQSLEEHLDFVTERRTRLDADDFRITLPYSE